MARKAYSVAQTAGVTVAVTYRRVSSDDQADMGMSLAAQTSETSAYVARMGWVLDAEFEDILTSKRDDRPAYQQALSRVRTLRSEGKSVVLVVAALDRLGRRLMERVRAREEFRTLGVATHSIREGGEVSDLTANILAVVAEEETRRLGERVRAVWREANAKGWYHTRANLPWGYTARPATAEERSAGSPMTVLDVDPVAAPRVREIFARAARGEPTRSIARWSRSLPEDIRGLRYSDDEAKATRRGRRVRDDVRQCSQRLVQALLRRSIYAGLTSDGKAGRWPALVDAETWATVQKRLDDNCAAPHADRSAYLLTSILRCPSCPDRPMHGQTYSTGRRYRCTGATQSLCSQTADAVQIDARVKDEVAGMLRRLSQADPDLLRAEYARLERPAVGLDHAAEVKRLQAASATHTRRIGDAARLLVDGTLDRVGYQALVGAEQVALQAAEAELVRLTNLTLVAEPAVKISDVLRVNWQEVVSEGSAEEVRDVIGLLVASIRPIRVRHGVYAVEVAWSKVAQRLLDASATLISVEHAA